MRGWCDISCCPCAPSCLCALACVSSMGYISIYICTRERAGESLSDPGLQQRLKAFPPTNLCACASPSSHPHDPRHHRITLTTGRPSLKMIRYICTLMLSDSMAHRPLTLMAYSKKKNPCRLQTQHSRTRSKKYRATSGKNYVPTFLSLSFGLLSLTQNRSVCG